MQRLPLLLETVAEEVPAQRLPSDEEVADASEHACINLHRMLRFRLELVEVGVDPVPSDLPVVAAVVLRLEIHLDDVGEQVMARLALLPPPVAAIGPVGHHLPSNGELSLVRPEADVLLVSAWRRVLRGHRLRFHMDLDE